MAPEVDLLRLQALEVAENYLWRPRADEVPLRLKLRRHKQNFPSHQKVKRNSFWARHIGLVENSSFQLGDAEFADALPPTRYKILPHALHMDMYKQVTVVGSSANCN